MKKKILMIHHSGLIGGAGISFYNTWLALEEKYSVVSYIADDPPDLLMFLRDKGLNPHTFPFRLGKLTYYSGGNNLLKPRFWYHALHSLFQISYWKKIICKEQPDLIIVNSKVLCWMGRIFKKFNIKSVCFVRETILGSPKKLMNRIMRNMLEDFTLVSFISNYDLRETGLAKAKAVVSYNVLDVANYYDKLGKIAACEQLNIPSDSFNVLFVGGINHLKGIDIAVRASASLKNEDITLVVAGSDSGAVPNIRFRSLPDILKRRNSIRFSKAVKKYIKNESIEEKVHRATIYQLVIV
jgi:glycosyltransferase involved in cell wall biosynthesis